MRASEVDRLTVPWPRPQPEGARYFFELPALAGSATLECDGQVIGEFRPSWTSQAIELDADWIASAPGSLVLRCQSAKVDLLGGFLPAIGMSPRVAWQGWKWRITGPAAFVRQPVLRQLPENSGGLAIHAAWTGPPATQVTVSVNGETIRERSHVLRREWKPQVGQVGHRRIQNRLGNPSRKFPFQTFLEHIPVYSTLRCFIPSVSSWSPDQPTLHEVTIELRVGNKVSEKISLSGAPRYLRADGERLLLNDELLNIRGLLHWGLYPELEGPNPHTADLATELRAMQARGFNLIKCCLFVPPRDFLQTCDQLGMLVWLEYPLWDQPLEDASLLRHYRRMVRHDQSHPSVILRTLTCENDRVHPALAERICGHIRKVVPHTMVNDNSGWLGSNYDADFYDEHPYLHNAQWDSYLRRTRRALQQLPDRPLILGETMVADSLEDPDSRHHALAIRRYQIERFREEFPYGGYVICGARDFAAAPLGLQTATGTWKYGREEWDWHGKSVRTDSNGRVPPWREWEGTSISENGCRGFEVATSLTDWRGGGQPYADWLVRGGVLLLSAQLQAGSWQTPEHLFWSPVPRWRSWLQQEAALTTLAEQELFFALLSGRSLKPSADDFGLLWLENHHDRGSEPQRIPLVLAGRVGRGILVVTALRMDTAHGIRFHQLLMEACLKQRARFPEFPLPETVPSFFLNGPWELRGKTVLNGFQTVKTGTPLCNAGRNVFQGWAEFRGRFTVPANWPGPSLLRAEAIGDGWELWIDGQRVTEHGNLSGTWDAGRDQPAEFLLNSHLVPGLEQEWRIRTKDHRGAGGLVGPLFLTPSSPRARVLY